MKITPRVPGEISLLSIGYKYNSRKVLRFVAAQGDRSTEPGDPYLSCFPDIYSNVSGFPVVGPRLLCRYFNACYAIDNQNRMWKSDLALESYWVTQSGYFRLATTVELGICITDWNLLYCHGVAEVNVDKKFSKWRYKNRKVYDCFNDPFIAGVGSLDLYLPPIIIDDRPCPHKEPYIPHIYSQMPSLFPLKNILVL